MYSVVCIFCLGGLHLPPTAQHDRQSDWFFVYGTRRIFELIIVSKRRLMSNTQLFWVEHQEHAKQYGPLWKQ